MAEQFGDKTQEATPHRRQQARDKGQVAFSQDLSSTLTLVGAAAVLLLLGGRLAEAIVTILREHLGGQGAWLTTDRDTVLAQLSLPFSLLLYAGVPVLLLLMFIGGLSSLLQTGFLWAPQRAMPDVSRISPLKGLKRIFSLVGVMRLGFGMLKVVVIFLVTAAVLYLRRAELMDVAQYAVPAIALFLSDVILTTTLWVGLALLLLALLDYLWQRWRHEQDLRMTHQEVREELKNLQGDPQIAARRKAIQRQLTVNRIGTAVPESDVIVTNPTELSVAIRYDPTNMAAPIVVAKGAGVLAQRIRRIGLEHNIPIVEKKELARLLYKEVDVNQPIPDKSYAAVAEVLAYVYQLKGKPMPHELDAA